MRGDFPLLRGYRSHGTLGWAREVAYAPYRGPIGAIRGSQRLSSVIFHGFCPFSLRDAAQSLPRLLPRVDGLLCPFFVSGFAARGCPRVELRAKNPKKTECGCCSGLSNLLARPLGPGRKAGIIAGRNCLTAAKYSTLAGAHQLAKTPLS